MFCIIKNETFNRHKGINTTFAQTLPNIEYVLFIKSNYTIICDRLGVHSIEALIF